MNNQTQSSTSLFRERSVCPVCASPSLLCLYQISYGDKLFRKFLELEQTYKQAFWGDYDQGLFENENYIISKCADCGFIFQRNVLNDSGLKRLYDQWIDPQATYEIHNNLDLLAKSRAYVHRLNIVLRQFSDLNGINILDWGGGFGDFCASATNSGVNVAALEFSDERKYHLEKRGIEVVKMDDLKENNYHFINLDQVLEHIVDPVFLLRHIRKYLRDDGILFVGTPKCARAEVLIRSGNLTPEVFSYLSPLQHINAFTNKTLKVACKNAKLKVLFSINPQPALIFSRHELLDSMYDLIKNFARPLNYYFLGTSFLLRKHDL